MKILIWILSIVAATLIIFNVTKLNFEAPFKDESLTAVITIIAGLCAIMLLQILRLSRKIEVLSKKRK